MENISEFCIYLCLKDTVCIVGMTDEYLKEKMNL